MKTKVLMLFLLCLFILSCPNPWMEKLIEPFNKAEEEEQKKNTSDSKAITAFTINGVAGVINETAKTISVTLPFGTSVTSLTPTVKHTGASYTPTGAVNFSTPQTYTVTATDTTTAEYTVTVTVAPSGTYSVIINTATGGSITADKTIGVTPGDTVTITASPSTNYVFKNLNSNVASVTFNGTGNTRTFSMPSQDITITPVFTPTYSVTVNGGTTANARYAEGDTVEITANTTPIGQQFSNWTISPTVTFTGGTSANTSTATFTMPASAVTVTANFEAATTYTFTGTVTSATLQTAITNIAPGGTITLDNVTITADSRVNINKDLTIEGKNTVWTRNPSNTISTSSQLLRIESGTVKVSGIHFKDGRAQDYGGAIVVFGGELILESCIFSGNNTNYTATGPWGGTICVGHFNSTSSSSAIIKGCTFYNNSTNGIGSAIFVSQSSPTSLTLTGNLFYENTSTSSTASYRQVVYLATGTYTPTFTSGGYNVFDVPYGTGNGLAGFTATANDTTFVDLGINFTPFGTPTFEPVAKLRDVMPSTPITDFPTTDYNGATRDWPGAPGAVK